jgi:hypothetical protein
MAAAGAKGRGGENRVQHAGIVLHQVGTQCNTSCSWQVEIGQLVTLGTPIVEKCHQQCNGWRLAGQGCH